jgi:hypothetical protein
MKITKRQLMNIIRESLVNEIGMGVGMGDSDLKHATTDPQNILAALSILPPAFVPAMVLSGILYFVDGKSEEAANTLALAAIFGGGARVISKILPALKAGMKAGGGAKSGSEEAVKLVKSTEDIINQTKRIIKPPKPHPKLPAKQASAYGEAVGKAMREEGLERVLPGFKAGEVFKNFSSQGAKSGINDKVFIIGPRGQVSSFYPKAYYDELGGTFGGTGKITLGDVLKEFFPGAKEGEVFRIYMGVPNAAGTTGKVLKYSPGL